MHASHSDGSYSAESRKKPRPHRSICDIAPSQYHRRLNKFWDSQTSRAVAQHLSQEPERICEVRYTISMSAQTLRCQHKGSISRPFQSALSHARCKPAPPTFVQAEQRHVDTVRLVDLHRACNCLFRCQVCLKLVCLTQAV